MKSPNGFRLMAFDLDGTLIQHYYPFYCREAVRLFPLLGSKEITLEQALQAFREERLFDFFPQETREEAEMEFWKLWDRSEAVRPVLLPGTLEVLKWFQRNEIKMVLVTGRVEPISEVEGILKQLGIFDYIDSVISLHGRTHSWMDKSSMILEMCETLNIDPTETIYFGDHPTDMNSARTTNCLPIGVLTGGIEFGKLVAAGASMVFDSVERILPFLKYENGRIHVKVEKNARTGTCTIG